MFNYQLTENCCMRVKEDPFKETSPSTCRKKKRNDGAVNKQRKFKSKKNITNQLLQ